MSLKTSFRNALAKHRDNIGGIAGFTTLLALCGGAAGYHHSNTLTGAFETAGAVPVVFGAAVAAVVAPIAAGYYAATKAIDLLQRKLGR